MNTLTATTIRDERLPLYSMPPIGAVEALPVSPLNGSEEAEVLDFLAAGPLHAVIMSGMIRDNGLVSPLNRGTFYACRNHSGQLEGVALIGHATMIEARSEQAVAALARAAQNFPQKHFIMCEQERIGQFWNYYAEQGQQRRLACRELLFEQRWPIAVRAEVRGLRMATLEDLDLIVPVHAQMAMEESGVNPLETDAEGFRRRCASRIEKGRVWVWVDAGKLIFKADIVAETPDCVYLEGIYVRPEERGKGYGLRCLSQLSRSLLMRANSICLLVNEQNTEAHGFYQKAGYKLRNVYDSIFLQRTEH